MCQDELNQTYMFAHVAHFYSDVSINLTPLPPCVIRCQHFQPPPATSVTDIICEQPGVSLV